jgi:hypothetical protein
MEPMKLEMKKSVQSINPCKSVVQTSYDMVKAHSGEISVSTQESEGTEFIIQLPMYET